MDTPPSFEEGNIAHKMGNSYILKTDKYKTRNLINTRRESEQETKNESVIRYVN